MVSRKVDRPAGILLVTGVASGGILLLAGLISPILSQLLTSDGNASRYLHLHLLIELATVLVSFAIFIVNWEATKQSRNSQSLLIATGFLAVAAFDTMHLLSEPGMSPSLGASSLEKSQYYWILARIWSTGVLLAASLVTPGSSDRWLNRGRLLAGNGIGSVALSATILAVPQLPPIHLQDGSLTGLGMLLGVWLLVLNLVAAATYMVVYRATRDGAAILVLGGLIMSLFAGIAHTAFSEIGIYDLMGHAYTVGAHYMIFKALLISAVERPYTQMRLARDRLEVAVAELDARNRELDSLDEVALTLSSSLKLDAVLDAAIEKVMKVMQAAGGAVFLTDDISSRMKLAAWRGLTPEVVRSCLFSPPELPDRVYAPDGEHGKTTLDDPALVRSLGGLSARISPFRACICAPVASKGSVLGVVAMVADSERSFTPRDADLLIAIGYQLGLAIENAWLYERTDERLREKLDEIRVAERRSRFLSEAGAMLADSADLGKVLDLLAEKTTEVVGDWCTIYLMDERRSLLRLEATYHQDEDELRTIRQILSRSPVKTGDGIIGRVAETGEPELVRSVSPEQFSAEVRTLAHSIQEIAALRSSAPSSAIVAPLRARGRTVGVVMVTNTHSNRPFDEADLDLVSTLADRAGVAVENSRLFRESQEQRRHLETVISQMVDGVVIVDRDARVVTANDSAQRMLGKDLERLVAVPKRHFDASATESRRVGRPGRPLARRALAGELVIGEELTIGEGNRRRILSASASAVRDEPGEISGAVVVLRDVTAEREIEKMKDEFVANVSHELRTPITAILGYSDILLKGLRGPLEPKQVKDLSAIRSGGQRLLLVINDLLDISKIEAGKQEFNPARVNLSATVSRVLSAVGVLAVSRDIQLNGGVSKHLPLVRADEEQLQRILGNLISNAVKFTPEGGTVDISAYPAAGGDRLEAMPVEDGGEARFVVVQISDTGVGIPAEFQEKIWEKFYQVDSSSRRMFGGTGLGLAITRSLVELHGGRIWVESEGVPGKGSTFAFTIPVAPPEAASNLEGLV